MGNWPSRQYQTRLGCTTRTSHSYLPNMWHPTSHREKSGFCCGPAGSRFHDVKPLPPLPPEYSIFINDPRISHLSRVLNLMLSFASLETTQPFPQSYGPPGFVAIISRPQVTLIFFNIFSNIYTSVSTLHELFSF